MCHTKLTWSRSRALVLMLDFIDILLLLRRQGCVDVGEILIEVELSQFSLLRVICRLTNGRSAGRRRANNSAKQAARRMKMTFGDIVADVVLQLSSGDSTDH